MVCGRTLRVTRPFLRSRALVAALVATTALVASENAAAVLPADAISYAYDELGRLTAVIDPTAPSNGVAKYGYDEVGNITAIQRLSSSGVSVVQLSPARGWAGSKVLIYGTNFSPTPSLNTVTFSGGATATVSEATKTQLHVTVPAGATTGTVAVTSPGGSATSDSAFTVVAAPQAPTITGFSPAIADPGTTVTVNGSNFGAAAADNVAAIGQVRGKIATASSSSLAFPVPSGATSGRVLVSTADGSVTSADDLFVAPSGFTAAQVMTTGRMAIGDLNRLFSVTDTSKIGLVLFEGNAGQYVFTNIPSATMTAAIELYDPFGIEIGSTAIGTGGGYVDTKKLPTSGTYTLLIDPLGGTSGNVTFSLYEATPSVATIAADGLPHTIANLTAGQNAIRSFTGTAGQRVFVKAETQMSALTVRLRDANGIELAATSLGTGVGATVAYIDATTLAAAGTYTLEADPGGAATGDATLTLYDVPADTTGTITPGGAAVTVTNSTPGQNGTRTFTGSLDQRISLKVSSVTIGSSGTCRVRVTIRKPDGSTLVANTCVPSSGAFFDTETLPVGGTYSILVDPIDDKAGSATLTLYDVPADTTGTITPGGAAVTVTNSTPGQNGTRTFTGSLDQRISLKVSSVTIGSSGICRVRVTIRKPDGSTLVANTCVPSSGAFFDTETLPVGGTYSILVDPVDDKAGSATLTLYDVPADPTGTMTIGGPTSSMTLSTPGQNGTRTFEGNSGQAVTLTLSSVTIGTSSCCSAKVSIKKPDGSNLVSPTLFGTSGKTVNTNLTATGAHTILIDPQDANTGGVTLALTSGGGGRIVAPASAPAVGGKNITYGTSSEAARNANPQRPARPARKTKPGYRPASIEDWIPRSTEPSTWFTGRPESPFESLPLREARPGITAISGRVLRLNGLPLQGVTIRTRRIRTQTDAKGRFLLKGLRPGRVVITADARSANRPRARYGVYELGVNARRGRTTALPYTIWSPKLDTRHQVRLRYPLKRDVVVKTPLIPGLEVRIPAGSEIHDRRGRLVRRIGITPVPLDRTPFPMPARFPVYFTIQPGAAYVWPHGVEIVYPNKMHAPPGQRIEFFSYDPEAKGWHAYGRGTVTRNGKQIRFDRGTRQYELTSSGICIGCLFIPLGQMGPFFPVGDPVDLGTGAFVHSHTDLIERGAPGLSVTRVYRSSDTQSRGFGVGNSMNYGLALYQPVMHDYSWAELVFPNGNRVRYDRISPGTGYTDMILQTGVSSSKFSKSKIAWDGDVFGWVLTLTDGSVYTFGNGGLLRSIRDRFGNQVTLVRSNGEIGDIVQALSSSGRWLKFSYGTGGRVAQVEDQSGRSVGYTYDGSGRLWKVTDVEGGVTEHMYDAGGRLSSIKDPRNIVWLENAYDGNGRVDTQTLPDEGVYDFAYTVDGSGNVTQTDVIDPRGYTRRVTFDSNRYPLTDTWAASTAKEQSTSYEYQTGSNLLLAQVDERNRRTEYEYNAAGRVTRVTRLAGTPDAVSTTYAYEPTFQQLTSMTDPLGHGPSFQYNSRGALTAIVDARGKQTTFTPNTAGRSVSVSDPLNNQAIYSYILNDLVAVTDPAGTTTRAFFDAAGRPTLQTDGLGRITRFSYDASDGLTSVTDASGNITTFERDGNGNVTKVIDPKLNETILTYNAMDRVATRKDHLLEIESFEYDRNGNLVRAIDRKGQVTTFSYDELDRLTFAGYGTTGPPENPTYESSVAYTYDNGNRLTQAVGSGYGTITLAYDDLDRATSTTTPEGTITYTYDDADRRETMTITGQPQVSYSHDNADQLTSLTRAGTSVTVAYDDASRVQSVTLPNAVVQSYAYDPASNLTGIEYTRLGSTLGDLVYGYDNRGLRTGVGGAYARTSLPTAVASATYNAANRLTSWGGQALTYDDNGNMTSDGTKALTWNARDQLVALSGGGTTASFAYDPFGRRASATLNGAQTRYLHDRDNVAQELNAAGAPQTNFLAGMERDEVFALIDSTWTRSVMSDAIGSTIATADSSGAIQAQYTYEPFGRSTESGTGGTPYQFTGRTNDGTGLQFNRARYYSPVLGRFISEDPMGFEGSDVNLYAYVWNSPLNGADPTGRTAIAIPVVAAAAAATVMAYAAVTNARKSGGGLPDFPFDPIGSDGGGGDGGSIPNRAPGSPPPSDTPEVPSDAPNFPDPSQPPGEDWDWRGTGPPGSSQGSWYNPKTGESLHPDLNHPGPIGPHYDYKSSSGKKYRVFPDGRIVPK